MSALARQATEAIVKAGRGVHFPADMRVSANSLLGDDSWCYSDNDKPRLKLYPDRLLTIVWRGPDAHAGCELPGPVVDVLKSFAFLYQNSPGTVVSRATKQTNHPRTVCQALHALLAFLGHVFETNGLPLGDCDFSLADIKLSHLRVALKKWGGCNQRNLKLCLTGLTFLLLRKIHPDAAPGWTASDIGGLQFRKTTPREEDNKVLPAPLFRLASNSASSVVCGFLTLLGTEVVSGEAGVLPQFLEPHRHQGRLLFTSYTELRHVRATEVGTPGFNVRGSACATILNKRFRATFKCTAKQMKDYLHQVHRATNAVIALYTGGRFSDLSFFMVGCLRKIGSLWFLMGTHIKHQDIDAPLGEDPWPAIPIMRDAVEALTELSKVSRNLHLLAALDARGEGQSYSPSGMRRAFNKFLEEVDVARTWSDVVLTPQRFRNTLANQLARADLALPYISRHLKHLHAALGDLPAKVTLTYGGIAELQVDRALARQELRKDISRSLYDLDAPVAGGGGKQFVAERKEYYRGRMEAGLTKDEVLDELVEMGLPVSSTGPGFCTDKRKVLDKAGNLVDPSCIGSLACAPHVCTNAHITQIHVAVWHKVAVQNENFSKRPDMAYARDEHLAKLRIAQDVLRDLGVRK